MVATLVTPAKVHCRSYQLRSSTDTQAHKTEVKLTAGVVVRMIDKEKKEGQWPVQGQARLRRWSTGGATGPKTMFSSTEQGEKRKNTLKMKPHRVREPFQVAAGHSIKIITIL